MESWWVEKLKQAYEVCDSAVFCGGVYHPCVVRTGVSSYLLCTDDQKSGHMENLQGVEYVDIEVSARQLQSSFFSHCRLHLFCVVLSFCA